MNVGRSYLILDANIKITKDREFLSKNKKGTDLKNLIEKISCERKIINILCLFILIKIHLNRRLISEFELKKFS